MAAGIDAADLLWTTLVNLLGEASASSTLLTGLPVAMQAESEDQDENLTVTIANAIGLLFQACDAMAGLIGNALVMRARATRSDLSSLIEHVLRFEAPVQNTRRWLIQDVPLDGCPYSRAYHIVYSRTPVFQYSLPPHARDIADDRCQLRSMARHW